MPNPSRAIVEAAYANSVKLLDEMRRAAGGSSSGLPTVNATNLLGLMNTLQTAYGGDWIDESADAVQAVRDAMAGIISPSVIASCLRPWLRQYCKSVIGRADLNSDAKMINEIYLYLQAQGRYVQSRGFTFGTPTAAGANTGTAQILRLTRDRYNFPIESEYVDAKRARCVADENTGTLRGKEQFEVVGQARPRDEIERSGSGFRGALVGQIYTDSILSNAGFRAFGGTAGSDAPTSLNSWTSTTPSSGAALAYNSTNYGIDATNYFRTFLGDATPVSLQVKVSARLTQLLTSAQVNQLSDNTPYLLGLVWNAALGSAVGTLNIRMGSYTTTVVVSGQAGWQFTTVPGNIPLGQGCWYRQFAQQNLQCQIEWISTSGTLTVQEALFLPGVRPLFGGTWYWAVPASVATYSQWRVRDEFTWADIATATTSKNQSYLNRGFPGSYWPSSNGSSIGFAEA